MSVCVYCATVESQYTESTTTTTTTTTTDVAALNQYLAIDNAFPI